MHRDGVCIFDIREGCVGQQACWTDNQRPILCGRQQRFKRCVELIPNPRAKSDLTIHEVEGVVVSRDDDRRDAIGVFHAIKLLIDHIDLSPERTDNLPRT